MDIETLNNQYSEIVGRASRLRDVMVKQLSKLLDDAQITLGIPIESRVKDWPSIEEKIDRKDLTIGDLNDLTDLIGVRAILLFRNDLKKVDKLIREYFVVLESEDTSKRLDETQFGYQSQHYLVKIPEDWLKVPDMKDLGDLQVELQVRTVAQHIWAAASHKLQYKQESNVPPPLRRTINRVSALLETVDLEFDRVLSERKSYKEQTIPDAAGSERLNVDLVASILSDVFPLKNRGDEEKYEDLHRDLMALSVDTVEELKNILNNHLKIVLEKERKRVSKARKSSAYSGTTKDRIDSGVFYKHVGLARMALRQEFGEDKIDSIIKEREK